MKNLIILVPCLNEEDGIVNVIKSIPYKQLLQLGVKAKVMVVDNGSTDKTALVAKKAGAIVVSEPNRGKGNAIRKGFSSIPKTTDYVVMIDGDDTYKTSEIVRLIEPLMNDFSDCIIGSRLTGKIRKGSMSLTSRAGNWGFTFLVREFVHGNVTDTLTGYFAWKREVVEKLNPALEADGFAIEIEMVVKMAKMGFEIYSVPITYDARAGQSKLRPIRDGFRILRMYLRALRWKPKK